MKDNIYDVAIIGAGPAGCAAALYGHAKGLNVCVIGEPPNQGKFISILGSESVHPGLDSLFKLLNFNLTLGNISNGYYDGIWVNDFYSELGREGKDSWRGYHLNKERLVQEMFKEIQRRDICIVPDFAVDLIKTDNKIMHVQTKGNIIIRAKNILDCSGNKRFATRKLEIQRKFYSPSLTCWSSKTESIPEEIHESLRTSLVIRKNSWEWLAPEFNRACTWTQLIDYKKNKFSPPEVFSNYSNKTKISVYNMRWSISRPLFSLDVLLCGDAGAIVDPASGQGIFFAMYSAIMATHVVLRSFESPEQKKYFFEEYDQWFLDHCERKIFELRNIYLSNGFEW